MFDRFEHMLEQFDGHFSELRYELRKPIDLDTGPVRPFDELFAAYEPNAHFADDWFRNKLAFVVLLNFPLTTLDQRLAEGEHWTRRQWAEARLAQVFSTRIPGEVNQAIAETQADAELYIDDYKICMHHLLDAQGGASVSARSPPDHPLESAGRDQGALRRLRRRPGPPAHDPAGHGADRRPVHPAGGDQQPAGGLESGYQ